jgi:SAM-dependent methyltransferase
MKNVLKRIIPRSAIVMLIQNPLYYAIMKSTYLVFGRPKRLAETAKAYSRRMREGFFESFCNGNGLDVGYGGDLLADNCQGWDFEHGDAQFLKEIDILHYDFVYSSHTLEHMLKPDVALKNWWRVVKPGGYLILYVPDRELYEKKKSLPSRWNYDHKHFFLLDRDEPPDTIGLLPLIERSLVRYEIVYAKECNEGHTVTNLDLHSDGEYSLEIVLRKGKK